MENGIKKEKFEELIKKQIFNNLQKIINHINSHSFVKAEKDDDGIKIVFLENVLLTNQQKENILDLFYKGGIVKSKDKEEYLKINTFTEK